MNLKSHISDRLWEAISSAYEAGNYAHAVLESMHVITEVLREKSGLDGDGNPLVGGALGGDNPKIRLNALKTDTERNIQKGFESILRGMYSAIRNPRSHESASDELDHADAIICFVNYLLNVLSASKEAFNPDAFMDRVTDPDFVDSKRYSDLLTAQVPPQRLGDTLIVIFNARGRLPLQKRKALIEALLRNANDSQIESLLAVVSEELKVTNDATDIKTTFQFLNPSVWHRLDESARLRVENKIISGIRNGKLLPDGSTNEWLATWAHAFLNVFTLRDDVATVLWLKLLDEDTEKRLYATEYFFSELPRVCTSDKEISRAVSAISKAVKGGDQHMRTRLLRHIDAFPESWQKQLVAALADLTDKEKPARILGDGTPFLTAEDDQFDDDIPF